MAARWCCALALSGLTLPLPVVRVPFATTACGRGLAAMRAALDALDASYKLALLYSGRLLVSYMLLANYRCSPTHVAIEA